MKKYLNIVLAIAVSAFIICFFLYKVGHHTSNLSVQESNISDVISDIPDQERNIAEILFSIPAPGNTRKVYIIGINGENLKELFTVDESILSSKIYSTGRGGRVVTTKQEDVNYIKNNSNKLRDFFIRPPLKDFSKNLYAYSMPIEENDIVTHSGEKGIAGNVCWVFKGVYLHNIETGKTVRIDSDLINQVPSSSFSRDGSLFITSLSFSHDGNFLFITSPPDYLFIFSVEQMKFIKVFNTNDIFAFSIHNVDKVLDNLYILAGTDSSNVFQFDMDKKKFKPLTNSQQSSFAVSPDNKSLVFVETCLDGKTNLGIVNIENSSIRIVDYPMDYENEYLIIAGFVFDSKHLIITHYHKLPDTDTINNSRIDSHIAIYLLNLNTLKEAKIYTETPTN